MAAPPNDFNEKVIAEFRANGGRVSGPLAEMDLLLLHHTGARTGTERVNPLAYRRDGDRYVVFASKAGAPTDPDWYRNLRANPRARIEVGEEELEVEASDAEGEERERLFEAQKRDSPQFADYEQKTGGRVIPVVVLTPTG